MKKSLRLVLLFFIWISTACVFPIAVKPPPTLVMVTVAPNASPTSTPFQPASGILAPAEAATLISSFTPLPPTNTPLPTLAFTATARSEYAFREISAGSRATGRFGSAFSSSF